jgi:hypothetical protein
MGKLKQKKGSPGKKLKPGFEAEPYPQFEHPVFCFRYLSKKYGLFYFSYSFHRYKI